MPRFARVVVPECAHHITQRGDARREVFYSPADRSVYPGRLKQYSEYYQLRILGYCLMTNHVHLVAVPANEQGLARTLREVHGRYARYLNALERSSGQVWQNRFYSCVVQEMAVGAVLKYVELNPVRAGLTQSAGEHVWSSGVTHLGGPDLAGVVWLDASRAVWPAGEWAEVLGRAEDQAAAIREAT